MAEENGNEIFFSLNIEDIQSVAQQELERSLTPNEIESIKELIVSKINWYDAIAEAINLSDL